MVKFELFVLAKKKKSSFGGVKMIAIYLASL